MKVTMTIDHLKRFGGLYLFLVTYVSDYMFVPTRLHDVSQVEAVAPANFTNLVRL